MSTAEGKAFRRQVYVAFTVTPLPDGRSIDDVKSIDALADLLNEDGDERAEDLATYPALHAAAERDGRKGLAPGFQTRSRHRSLTDRRRDRNGRPART